MDELVRGLVSKVGITEEQGKAVFKFLKENADKVPEWLGLDVKSLAAKLPGGLGNLFK